jgi:hypothetical protein
METSAFGGQAKPVAVNATGFNRWKFTSLFSSVAETTAMEIFCAERKFQSK